MQALSTPTSRFTDTARMGTAIKTAMGMVTANGATAVMAIGVTGIDALVSPGCSSTRYLIQAIRDHRETV